MTRHRGGRRSRWRAPASLGAAALVLGVAGAVVLVVHVVLARPEPPDGGSAHARPFRVPVLPAPAVQPTRRAQPRFLVQGYRAPPALVDQGRAGTLRIPALQLAAPVDAVGLDHETMAVPDDPDRLGWLRGSAAPGDVVGSSVLAGHVSDARDRPGALGNLDGIELGAEILWTDGSGRTLRFRVSRLQRFPRAQGLPVGLFRTDGPRRLQLVTCADRRSTASGGFHYAANLVVTAVPETGRTTVGGTG